MLRDGKYTITFKTPFGGGGGFMVEPEVIKILVKGVFNYE